MSIVEAALSFASGYVASVTKSNLTLSVFSVSADATPLFGGVMYCYNNY